MKYCREENYYQSLAQCHHTCNIMAGSFPYQLLLPTFWLHVGVNQRALIIYMIIQVCIHVYMYTCCVFIDIITCACAQHMPCNIHAYDMSGRYVCTYLNSNPNPTQTQTYSRHTHTNIHTHTHARTSQLGNILSHSLFSTTCKHIQR